MPKTFPTPCTKEEINSLIDASMESDYYYTLFMTAKTTGRRLGELYAVKVKDFYPEKGVLITQVLKRKKPVEKEAILNEEVTRLIKIYIAKKKLKLDDYLFRENSYRHIQYMVKKFAQKAGIQHPVSFHNFRHYLITELVRSGMHYDQIAKVTGHGNSSVLVNYDHSTAVDIKEKVLTALKDI